MSNHTKTRVVKSTLQETGRARTGSESVENIKITNDHAFYKLISEKQAHGDFSGEQFDLLYFEISEKMIKKPFTIQEINEFCRTKGIPLFDVDELLTLIPRDGTKGYVNYEANTVKDQGHGYMAGEIGIKASYIEAASVNHHIDQNYVVDSDAYYKFIYKKVVEGSIRNWVLENLNASRLTEEQMREYLNNSNTSDKGLKQWLENNPQGNLREWLSDPLNKGYTQAEYHTLYEKISEELVHTSFSISQIREIYNKYGITPPTENEFSHLVTIQEETRSSDHYEEKTGLTFQGRVNIKATEDDSLSANSEFNLNIDLFQRKGFEDGNDSNGDSIINNEGLLKALEDTVKTFNEVFGIKKDNNPLLAHGNVANFRLFLFENKESYQEYLSKKYAGEIPGGGAAESSDNNYISNMYSHAENARGDFNHDGKTDNKDYNYVIKHELVHALTFYLTSKLDLGTVLMEGLAEYVTHLTEGDKVPYFAKLVGDKYKGHTLEEVIKEGIDPYQTGAAVIAYIEQTYPNFIDNLLYAATEDRKTLNGRVYFKQMMQKIYSSEAEKIENGGGFQHWVQANSRTEGVIGHTQPQNDEGQHTSHKPEEQKVQQKSDKTEEKAASEDNQSDWNYSDFGTPGVIGQAASGIANEVSDWWSNWWSDSEEEQEVVTESKGQPSSGSSSLRGLARMDREDEMQSDQPQQDLPRPTRSAAHKQEQEQIVLKDTILKVQKSYDRDSEGKHKANVTIDYDDIKSLYDRAEGADKQSVLKFWHKLHASEYKVGVLPEEQYYFKDGKFVIHDSDAKKLVVLPADKISIKIMKLGNDYDLVITNENGKVISDVSRVDHLNYELLSDASGFSLEMLGSIQLSDPHSEYDSYLISGLGGQMFDCPSYHDHDHNLI